MKEEVARALLSKEAVKLNAKEPFTFVSGIRSPIYCDNRQMIAYPNEREMIVDSFVKALKDSGLDFDVLAGTATAGIPWAAFVAQKMGAAMSYIRPEKKEHGAGKQIEGASVDGKKVVVIEDLVSTGGSSMRAVEAARTAGAEVVAMVAIFTYEFEKAKKKFDEGNCNAITLSDFSTLAGVAKEEGYLDEKELEMVLEWNKNAAEWGPKHGFPNAEAK
jgi:orotate phosphoribosyltransferase